MPRLTRAELLAKVEAIPNPRERQAGREYVAKLYAVPPPDKNREQALKWAEAADPEKCIAELFGYKLDSETRRLVYLLEHRPKVMAIGAHDRGKTFIGWAVMFAWHWYVKGCEPDEAGQPKGAILALVANKLAQTLKTSWAAIRRHAENAEARGHVIPGWPAARKLSAPALDGSLWRIHPQLWYIVAESFQAPAAKSGAKVVSAGAGLKHPHSILVGIEEADRLPRQMFRTVQGWSRLQKRFGALNPYTASGAAYDLVESGEWESPRFSYLKAPDVLNREQTIPGGASHLKLESEMRSPFEVRRLGAAGEVEPDASKGDFLYALPDLDEPEMPGPRADGIPGHPLAEPSVWRPSPEFQAGRLGQFPSEIEAQVFWGGPWREAEELRDQLPVPESTRDFFDVVGIDTAEGGPDRIVCLGRQGPSARELWRRYMAELQPARPSDDPRVPIPQGRDSKTALAMALRCDYCGGQGCGICWDGIRWIYYGDPVELEKSNDARLLAQRIVDIYGTRPAFRLDQSAGGYWLEVPLRNLGCEDVATVAFSANPTEPLPGQRLYRNMRAQMAGSISYVLHLGAVAMTADAAVRAGCRVLQWEPVDYRGQLVYKLQDKTDVKAALGGISPDAPDALKLTEGIGQASKAEVGRVDLWQ